MVIDIDITIAVYIIRKVIAKVRRATPAGIPIQTVAVVADDAIRIRRTCILDADDERRAKF